MDSEVESKHNYDTVQCYCKFMMEDGGLTCPRVRYGKELMLSTRISFWCSSPPPNNPRSIAWYPGSNHTNKKIITHRSYSYIRTLNSGKDFIFLVRLPKRPGHEKNDFTLRDYLHFDRRILSRSLEEGFARPAYTSCG